AFPEEVQAPRLRSGRQGGRALIEVGRWEKARRALPPHLRLPFAVLPPAFRPRAAGDGLQLARVPRRPVHSAAEINPQPHVMAKNATFDITSTIDLQEVDNAVNQARKEVAQRYDFKGARVSIEFDRAAGTLVLSADDDYRLKSLVDVLQTKLVKRGVPIRNLDY